MANLTKSQVHTRQLWKWFKGLKEWKCSLCEEDSFCALDFHHINPEDKLDSICRLVSGKYKKERILKELDKCVCLCANCHRKHHAGEMEIF